MTRAAGRMRVCRDCCRGTALKHPRVNHDSLFEALSDPPAELLPLLTPGVLGEDVL